MNYWIIKKNNNLVLADKLIFLLLEYKCLDGYTDSVIGQQLKMCRAWKVPRSLQLSILCHWRSKVYPPIFFHSSSNSLHSLYVFVLYCAPLIWILNDIQSIINIQTHTLSYKIEYFSCASSFIVDKTLIEPINKVIRPKD